MDNKNSIEKNTTHSVLIHSIINKLTSKENLSRTEAEQVMENLLSGTLTQSQIAAFLVSLRMKGETTEEIASLAKIMREKAVKITPKVSSSLVDTCGTGGDSSNTFNISSASAIIAAGAGVPIAKHCNRSVSSKCGSADVFEALGGSLLQPEQAEKSIEQTGIGFLFAPFFHPTFKYVMPVRKELGIRTVFNLLGPLANPAAAQHQLLGVYSPDLTEPIATVLGDLGSKHALVVHSEGMDEIGFGETKVSELKNGKIQSYSIHGSDFGFKKQSLPKVTSKEESAKIILAILSGNTTESDSARDSCILNAAASIYLGGFVSSIDKGISIATDSIHSGKALAKLKTLVKFCDSESKSENRTADAGDAHGA
ncbi:anthranilate phosphoribosyltransferase [Candidatus Micrarchaeota archaeon]|nr:anthranilate phosphoribosyltransferase [Candidatus Micrarchaeota archaeon]